MNFLRVRGGCFNQRRGRGVLGIEGEFSAFSGLWGHMDRRGRKTLSGIKRPLHGNEDAMESVT